MSYVELQIKTNFSFLRGAAQAEEIADVGSELGYKKLGVCDINTLAGVVRAHCAGKEKNIRSFVGSELLFYENIPEREKDEELVQPEALIGRTEAALEPLSIIVYPLSKFGYGTLSKLLTLGKSRAPKACCYLRLADILEGIKECSFIISISDPFHRRVPLILEAIKEGVSKEFLSLAVTDNYGANNRRRTEKILELKKEFFLSTVVTNNVYFHRSERKPLQDILTCIRKGIKIEDIGFQALQNNERHLKPPEEMIRLFRWLPEGITRTAHIAEGLEGFSLDQLKYEYPQEIFPGDETPLSFLKRVTWQGARKRYPEGVSEKVIKQIRHEFQLIEELDYSKYFLTVYDIVNFARSQKILCQGRGAAANSAVCYCLGITEVNPNQINLLFERFVSKERNEPPDIDIDFEHERREEVIQYIYNKYGRDRAALVAEVITYRTRSAVREVGKVFGLELEEIEKIVRLLTRYEEEKSLEEHLAEYGLEKNARRVLNTINHSQQLMGFPRHLSQHVGGFVISDPPLSGIVPIENASMPDRTVIEWDKDDVDKMGMLKVDCLGLGMLTCIRKALAFIGRSFEDVPREDRAVYEMICKADTIGVFQIESRAQMTMLPRLRPQCFYDLVIEVAIVRPGPIQGGMVHPYLRRRMGKEKIIFPSKAIEKVLKPTLGIPIFQEQAMELTVVAAGFSKGEADALRRAMASWKRNKNSLRQFEGKFIQGMVQNGYSLEYATQCFGQIRGFGEYGFPQSHAASFAHLVYVSAWLKKFHPAAFCAALINSQPMGFYQPAQLLSDAESHGVEIRPVDINYSVWDCTLERDDRGNFAVRVGLRVVKGLQEKLAKDLVTAVKTYGPFKTVTQLWRKSLASVSTLKALARADAFQSLALKRQEIHWELARLKDHSLPLMEMIDKKEEPVPLPELSLENEMLKDYLSAGFSLKAHPVDFFREKLNARGARTTEYLKASSKNGVREKIGGIVLIRQRPPTAKGFVFITIEDETGSANLIVKPPVYRQYRDVIYDSVYLFVTGRVQKQEGVTHLVVESAENLNPVSEETPDLVRNFF